MNEELKKYFDFMQKRPEEFIKSDLLSIITDEDFIEKYCLENNVRIGVVYESRFHIMVVDLVKDNKGRVFTYERIINTVPGGTVMLTLHNGKYVLLDQFRHALRNKQYAFPRGFRELGISSLENAKKEISEEIHIHDKESDVSYKFLGKVVADSGLSGNIVDIYCVIINNSEEKLYSKDTEEIIASIEVTDEKFQDMVHEGIITDGFSLSAYSLFKAKKNADG